MDMNVIIWTVCIVAGLGLLVGIILGVVGKVFEVHTDPLEEQIRELLPGNNCGGCGFAGCDSLAAAIAKGEAEPGACPVGGLKVAQAIGELTGREVDQVKKVAFIHCAGDRDDAGRKYIYTGNANCKELQALTGGGSKICTYGCLGHGACLDACQFDAIKIDNGLAVVNPVKCKGCGACVKECPRNLIELVTYIRPFVAVACNSCAKGKEVMAACKKGCIGCKLCEKNCPNGAVHVENNLAVIDYEKCTQCGVCVQKCPRKIIRMYG